MVSLQLAISQATRQRRFPEYIMCKIGEHYCRDDDRFIRDTLRPPCRLKELGMAGGGDNSGDDDKSDEELGSNAIVNPFDSLYKMNFNHRDGRTVFLSRHGESEYNLTARIGGNPPLTSKGQRYAKALGSYINSLGNSHTYLNIFYEMTRQLWDIW